ncbi:MAG: Transcriptional regulatory protein OmpR [Alphaproteobacteria bacterium MarineAlpha5_Bin5]|nr:MAG: Transcriptional regulatory protein OmpR [Alphaproteobacteria bacterium MarineAlpha5_Bin5]PPR52639.1 MAG: Transcriptional regulatory protein OmpR [Alphaproteobacteria bacterium MarineAlpha5_Bin4]|tara:strand:+ start:6630 stop:7310 length:681 start_codon:yes stop_codon:yes gene_type:complete
MKKNILIVDDDQRLRELLKDYLSEKKLEIYVCDDFSSAKEIITFLYFDLIILDRMMPSGDGIDLISYIKNQSNTPVIMLTAMGEDINKIDGLKTGADDYVAKPFEPEELYLRINKLLNIYDTINKQQIIISFGDYTFNTTTLNLKKNEDMIYLTEGENDLMLKLISKRNNIVLREELADSEYDETELRKIDVRITRLRQKIEINPKQPQYIKTIRGKGYKIICNKL